MYGERGISSNGLEPAVPHMSRRQVLSLLPAAGLVTLAAPVRAAAAAAAAGIDHPRLLANTVAILAGTPEVNVRPEVAGKLAAIAGTAAQRLTAMDGAGDGELFAGLKLGTDDANLRLAYQYLYEIALATRTPGGRMENDLAARRRVADGLRWLHERHFGDQAAGYYGNWHNWEIGIPTHVSRTLALLADQAPADLTRTYIASMDAYLRNGKDGDVDLDSRFHTGANLADITANRILQGALTGDDARVAKAIADQATVFATIDPYDLRHGVTDGYYRDGSFIQHHSVAYTGSYGRILLTRVVQTLKTLEGATGAAAGELPGTVYRWLTDGFAPLIFEGWMMEIVKGRAVARTATGYTDVGVIVEAIADLADHVDDAAALALRKYLRFLPAADPAAFVSPVSIARYAAIRADASVPAADLNPPARTVAYNAMDRNVHRRPGYAFALARSSERISKYEYMNGENLMPWFQGDGAYYLYLTGEDQREVFGVDYYTAVSPYRLAGVTAPVEERRTVPDLYGRFWYENPGHPLGFTSSSQSQNTYVYFPRAGNAFSGGATLGAYGVAGMVQSDDVAYTAKQQGVLPDDFVAYRNARATKSWFMLDDEIVVLAAGVSGAGGRAAVTTVDSRIAAPGDAVTLTGERWQGGAWRAGDTTPPRWLRYANGTRRTSIGYAFLTRQPVAAGTETVTRSRRVVRAANPDTAITKNVFTAAVTHPAGEVHALAYALVPNATEAALRRYARGPLAVLANTPHVQAIAHRDLGIVAANAFSEGPHRVEGPHPVEGLVVDGPASVVVRVSGGRTVVALSDPTMGRERVGVVLRGRRLRLDQADEGVTVRRVPGGTLVEATTHHAYGRTFTATLR
ncbi:polysaccharide lyase family 8 super-sandwich domain-containing protein [Nonomuraea candida]|uniref:polysaccharide lyase family 8 super-sandwich domain-containing protein n=1 Tax=Nonomuraea candida TaxID=359159 RepID=UPI0009FC2107|nr:polysaccharide lyase family 8 super-sandwich domain-containing protein [Nonomuraea candida]